MKRTELLPFFMECIRYFIVIVFIMFISLLMILSYLNPAIVPIPLEKVHLGVELREPLAGEVTWFLAEDQTDKNEYNLETYNCYNFALDTIKSAETYGIRCYLVILIQQDTPPGDAHAVIAFHTTDMGWRYYEPQNDKLINPGSYEYRGTLWNQTC